MTILVKIQKHSVIATIIANYDYYWWTKSAQCWLQRIKQITTRNRIIALPYNKYSSFTRYSTTCSAHTMTVARCQDIHVSRRTTEVPVAAQKQHNKTIACTHIHRLTQTHAGTHACTHTHTHTHKHTHTHMHKTHYIQTYHISPQRCWYTVLLSIPANSSSYSIKWTCNMYITYSV